MFLQALVDEGQEDREDVAVSLKEIEKMGTGMIENHRKQNENEGQRLITRTKV
jgi:hypothetical protein